jgi:hypothetical protein
MTDISDAELRRRITAGEDELTELKKSAPKRADLRRTLVAFANSLPEGQVGTLFVGVGDSRQPVGVQNADSIQRTIAETARQDCYPPIPLSGRVVEVAGTQVLAVLVPHSTKRPHFAGAAYVREGSRSVTATEQQYEELIASRHDVCRKIQSWGKQVVSVEVVGKRLGDARPLEAIYRESHEAQIEGCDGHTVRLFDIGLSQYFSEPLENVLPMYDEKKHRPKLRVRFPR